jgi:hypothetical protein
MEVNDFKLIRFESIKNMDFIRVTYYKEKSANKIKQILIVDGSNMCFCKFGDFKFDNQMAYTIKI